MKLEEYVVSENVKEYLKCAEGASIKVWYNKRAFEISAKKNKKKYRLSYLTREYEENKCLGWIEFVEDKNNNIDIVSIKNAEKQVIDKIYIENSVKSIKSIIAILLGRKTSTLYGKWE